MWSDAVFEGAVTLTYGVKIKIFLVFFFMTEVMDE